METILNFVSENFLQLLLLIVSIILIWNIIDLVVLKKKYSHQGCDLIDAQLNYKKYLKGNNELILQINQLMEENIALNSGLGKMESDTERLHARLQTANINLINAKGQVLFLKQRKKEVSHEGVYIADPAKAATVYHDFKGWRVKRHGSVGYIAGYNMISGEVILGFYEYTGNNNIAITDDCIMSRREFVDYNAVTVNELRELGFV